LLVSALVALATTGAASAGDGVVLHEPIPPDPREDLAMHVVLDGDLPAAIQTPGGLVGAPDPRQPPSPSETAYGASAEHDAFTPDRDTRRPEVSDYDDPFTPSTAPFKRVSAYDAVRRDFTLYVRDERLTQVPLTSALPGADEEAFYADIVVDVAPDRRVRIPSVGPGARIVRARLGIGAQDMDYRVWHDGADNWFLQATGAKSPARARLVMELAAPRASFGADMGIRAWGELPLVPPLPDNVAREAAEVRAAIGVSRDMRTREALARLVKYFRSFVDSDELPRVHGSVYLDLTLSKKGVCRHRAFAFLVTAQSLGIPTRMVVNEAHAWVEVQDGTLWKRIDLGGAGHLERAANSAAGRLLQDEPRDAFGWPAGVDRGQDMVAEARTRAAGEPSASASALSSSPTVRIEPRSSASSKQDDRGSSVSLVVTDPAMDIRRGFPLHLRGELRDAGEPCPHAAVELWLRDTSSRRMLPLGTMATDEDGAFAGAIVIPTSTPLGDYEVVASKAGTR
jgi:hypothetical protein